MWRLVCWHTDRVRRMVKVGTGLVGVGLVAVEVAAWRASRAAIQSECRDPRQVVPGEAVIMLGCPFPVLQRWRTRIGVRSTDPSTARLVFTGAATRGDVSEAKMMADYAVGSLGVPERSGAQRQRARHRGEYRLLVAVDRGRTCDQDRVQYLPRVARGGSSLSKSPAARDRALGRGDNADRMRPREQRVHTHGCTAF